MQYKGINRMTREKILGSEEFKKMRSLTYGDVLDHLGALDSAGGLVRGVPHKFLCLIQKMGAVSPKEAVVAAHLESLRPTDPPPDDPFSMERFHGNVYLVAALLLHLRLSSEFHVHKPLMKAFLADFRKMSVVDEQNREAPMYLDVFVDDLLNKSRVFSVHLRRPD